jgi:hypothetical protein
MRVRARFEVEPGEVQSATVSFDSALFGNFGAGLELIGMGFRQRRR